MTNFEIFWSQYPKKKSKGQARKTWLKLKKAKMLPSMVVLKEAITIARASEDWKRDDGQFIPHPSTWLNAEGWDDVYRKVCLVDHKPATRFMLGPDGEENYLCPDCIMALRGKRWDGATSSEIEKAVEKGKVRPKPVKRDPAMDISDKVNEQINKLAKHWQTQA